MYLQSDSLCPVLSVLADADQYLGAFGAAAAQLRGWFWRRVNNSQIVTTNSKYHVIRVLGFFPPCLFTLKLSCCIFTLFAQLWGPFGVQPVFAYPKELRLFWKRCEKLEGSLFAPLFSLSVMTQNKTRPGVDPWRISVAGYFPSWEVTVKSFCSSKQLSVYKTSFPLISWQLNFFNSLQCGTLSEALWKFKYIMSSEFPLSACSLTLL